MTLECFITSILNHYHHIHNIHYLDRYYFKNLKFFCHEKERSVLLVMLIMAPNNFLHFFFFFYIRNNISQLK